MERAAIWSELVDAVIPRQFDRDALYKIDGRWGDLAQRVLASPLLDKVPPRRGFDAAPLRRLFNLDLINHCFDEPAHDWARFHEPQITGGLVHYLGDGGTDLQLARALSFYRAARLFGRKTYREIAPEDVATFELVAEEPTTRSGKPGRRKRIERGKIDILVHFKLTDGSSLGAALEAKFDHILSPGQLDKYSEHLITKRRWVEDCSPRLLVGRRPTALPKSLGWHATSWWRFLLALEREAQDCDDPAYRRFRRTIWKTAYG
jgi:hypothetical protein